jgi:hypothetical protein
MTDNSAKKISRRDAIKVLAAAAGAATLANIPSKWSKPGLAVGVLPAHAATSSLHTLAVEADKGPDGINICFPDDITSSVTISPANPGISMSYSILASSEITIHSPSPLTGAAATDATGKATLVINAETTGGGTIAVTWSFTNAGDGSGSGTQTISAGGC